MKKFALLLGILTVLYSCKGRKQVLSTTIDEQFLSAYWSNQQDYEYMSLKGRMSINSQEITQSASLNVRMKKDSIIWMSIGVLGFEGARVLITADSFKMINRLNGTYIARSAKYIQALIGFEVRLGEIQNMLIGNAPFDSSSYLIQKTDSMSWLHSGLSEIQNTLFISKTFQTMESHLSSNAQMQEVDVFYSEYEDFANLFIPAKINAEIKSGLQTSSAEITYSNVRTETIFSFPFTIPQGIKKI